MLKIKINLRLVCAALMPLMALQPERAHAQSAQTAQTDQAGAGNSSLAGLSGWRLYEVSLSSQYYSYGSPQTTSVANPTTSPFTLQESAAMGWSKNSDRSRIEVDYAPSYVEAFHGLNYRSFNQSFSALLTKTFNSKWSAHASARAVDSDLNQLLFAPTLYGSLAATPATFDQLVAAMLTGTSGNPALAQIVGAAPVVNSPAAAYPYGGRMFSVAADMSLSYAYSSRMSFSVSFGATRTQNREGGSGNTFGLGYAVPKTIGGSLSVGSSFSLTPRTSVGVNAVAGRTMSKFEDAYTTQVSGSLSHTLSRHWFLQAMAGVGYINSTAGSNMNIPQSAQHVFGASVAYKVYAQTFAGSYSRSISDIYGLGASATESGSGGWTWNRPSRTYSISANVGYSRLIGPTFPNAKGWNLNTSMTKAITPEISLSVSGAYAQYPQYVTTMAPTLSLTGVMATVSWAPWGERMTHIR